MAMIRAVGGGPGVLRGGARAGQQVVIGGMPMGLRIVPEGTTGFKSEYLVNLGIGSAENFLQGNHGFQGGKTGFVLGYKQGRPFIWILSVHIDRNNIVVRLEKEHDTLMPVGIVTISASFSAHIGERVTFPRRTLPGHLFTHEVEFSAAQLLNDWRRSNSEKTLEFSLNLTVYGMDSLFLGHGTVGRAIGYARVLAHGRRVDWRILTGPNFHSSEERRVHSKILGKKSPYFERLCTSSFMEESSRTLRLTDISLEALDILLVYLYTDKVAGNWRNVDIAQDLINAAEKYELPKLKTFFDWNLVHIVTPENVNNLIRVCEIFDLHTARVNIKQFCRQRGDLYRTFISSLY